MGLCGSADDHCCYLREWGVCPYVRAKENDPTYKWECSLRTDLGSWEAVYASDEYQGYVKPKLLANGHQVDCGDWPPVGKKCNTCGQIGTGLEDG